MICNILVIVSLLSIIVLVRVEGHKCFICGADGSLTCDNFDPNNKIFIEECPPDAKSCSIQTDVVLGVVITRSCETIILQDCKRANNIQYCYCTSDLCNGRTIQLPEDDEDFIAEGSGLQTTENTSTTSNHIVVKVSNASQLKSYFYITFIFLVILFYK